MSSILTAHIGDLAESLNDLRLRFRQAARYEVARAIGEALREAAMALVCGPSSRPASSRRSYSDWDDPWGDPAPDPWHGPDAYASTRDTGHTDRHSAITLSPAVLVGLGVARWSYTRSRQIGPAILIGVLITLAATVGGPTVKALLRAWSVANDLLDHSKSDPGL